jgi:S1-C subfamily serine protease
MGPEHEPGQGQGDDMDDDAPRSNWLPPDDRLWRHPSEVRSYPAPTVVPARPSPVRGWLAGPLVRSVPLTILSGVVGAAACAGLLYATGAVGNSPVWKPQTAPATVVPRDAVPGTGPSGAAVVDTVEPWVVGLSVNGDQGVETGSGVALVTDGEDCYVVTDSALFTEAGTGAQVSVSTFAGATLAGRQTWVDASAGIAIVMVRWSPGSTPVLGTVANTQTGEEVYALGSPVMSAASGGSYFADGPVTDQVSYIQPPNDGSAALFSMLVADISVDSSAYGGPLVDASGNLIGITNPASSQMQKPALTYITPVDVVMADVSSLVRYGHLPVHAWLGITQATDLNGPEASRIGVQAAVRVDAIAAGSPLAKAGVKVNDVITAVAGTSTTSAGALVAWLADARPDQVVSVNWLHQGHRHSADVTLAVQPASPPGS